MDLAHFCLHALARYVVACTESRFPGLDVRAALVNQHERRLRVVGLGGLVEGSGAGGDAPRSKNTLRNRIHPVWFITDTSNFRLVCPS